MSFRTRQNSIIATIVCLLMCTNGAGWAQTLDSPEAKLVAQIRASEKAIKGIRAHVIATIPDNKNDPRYGDDNFFDGGWAYSEGKQAFVGLVYAKQGDNGPFVGVRRGFAFDGDKFRIIGDDNATRMAGRITSLTLPGFRAFPLPLKLFGYDIKIGFQTLSEALSQAKSLHLRPPELIDGHSCIPIEVVGLETDPGVDPIDAQVWIDTACEFRPRAWATYLGYGGKNRFVALQERVQKIELQQINGHWIPVSGEFCTFKTSNDLPAGMSEEDIDKLPQEAAVQLVTVTVKQRIPTRIIRLETASVEVNKPLPDGIFTINYPAGCGVYDEFKRESVQFENGPGHFSHPLLAANLETPEAVLNIPVGSESIAVIDHARQSPLMFWLGVGVACIGAIGIAILIMLRRRTSSGKGG